jgi:hypothetical protein
MINQPAQALEGVKNLLPPTSTTTMLSASTHASGAMTLRAVSASPAGAFVR